MESYQDLLARCKREDAQAQRILYDVFKARLMGLCRRYTRDREAAKDVLQESFIRIFHSLHQLDSHLKLESWMKSVVVNTAINHFHKFKKHEKVSSLDNVAEDETPGDVSVLSDELLISIVNGLPDGCRMVFNLFVVEGYSHAEIASMLKVTEGTSRSQLHHAKTLLKLKLKCQDLAQYYEKFA
jgi:RNA polymerase sigma factor (sigma-70 family)